MADISGTISNRVETNFGLEFLEGFLMAIGVEGIINKVRNSFASKNTHSLKFRFADITRDYTDLYWLSEEISASRFKKDSAMYGEDYRYFLVAKMVRSPSINIIAEDEQMRGVDVDVKAIQLAGVSTGVSVEKAGKGEVTFKGKQSLAFGVELYDLLYDIQENGFRFNTITDPVKLRDKGTEIFTRTNIKPAFIGNAREKCNAFLSLVENQ